jgi:phosphate starvation-inducible protein PhoH and related proteins
MANKYSSPNPNNSDPKFHGTPIIEDKHGKILRPITKNQQILYESIQQNDIIFVNGPAGTGKTCISTWVGIAGIDSGKYEQLILTRPIQTSGEDLGFLPGTIDEKVSPFMEPLFSAIEQVKGKRITTEHVKEDNQTQTPTSKYKSKKGIDKYNKPRMSSTITPSNEDFYKKVQVCPVAYMRGATKAKSFIVIDEAQNLTSTQIRLIITRIGYGSKLIICGDATQSDLDGRVKSGFREAQTLLKGINGIGFITMTFDDIVRHRIIKDILIRYANYDAKSYKSYNNREFIENEQDLRNYDFTDDDYDDDDDDYDYDDDDDDDDMNIELDYTNIESPKVTKI